MEVDAKMNSNQQSVKRSELNEEIENTRKQMNDLADRYGIADKRVLKTSTILDNLLNDYYKIY